MSEQAVKNVMAKTGVIRELYTVPNDFLYDTERFSYIIVKKRTTNNIEKILEIPLVVFNGSGLHNEQYQDAISLKNAIMEQFDTANYIRLYLSKTIDGKEL